MQLFQKKKPIIGRSKLYILDIKMVVTIFVEMSGYTSVSS